MTASLFDLQATHEPHRWRLPITEAVSVGRVDACFLFGGAGLAAGVTALERTCGRPVIWATAQYLSFARPPSIMDLDVRVPALGQLTTQAKVTGHVGDQEILAVNAALGDRPGLTDSQWSVAPAAPRPEACRPALGGRGEVAGIHQHLTIRIALGRYRTEPVDTDRTDGRLLLWMQPRQGVAIDAAMLAIMADFLPSGVINATGDPSVIAKSLDNTIRYAGLEPTGWVLCDIQIESLHRGFAHGAMRMYSEGGKLMAIASQSMIIRRRKRGG